MQVSVLLSCLAQSGRSGNSPDRRATRRSDPRREDDQRLRWSSACWSPPPESNRRPHPYHGSAAKRRANRCSRSSYDTVDAPVMCSVAFRRGGSARSLRARSPDAASVILHSMTPTGFPATLPVPRRPDPLDVPALRWGVLGTGWIAERFVQALRTSTTQQVVAVGSRTQASAERFAGAAGVLTAHGSPEAL